MYGKKSRKYHDKKKCVLKYSKSENVNSVKDIKHPLIRNCLALTKIWGLDIHSIADIPGGTGLGSSSSFTVSLLNALYYYKNRKLSKHDLAKKACHVEINLLKAPVGKQDQYAASYGGVNTFIFKKNNDVIVKKFINKSAIKNLKNNLLLINTNTQKINISTLHEQRKNIMKGGKYLDNLKFMKDSVEIFKNKNRENVVNKSKTTGEPPLMNAMSVFFAIKDAIASVGNYKIIPELNAPATSEKILMSIKNLKSKL
mgnify:CR=1 FL=1